MGTKITNMKRLKCSKFLFVSDFMLCTIIILFFLGVYLFAILNDWNNGIHLIILLPFLMLMSILGYHLFFIINYYLYDKNTLIEIDTNGNVMYSNMNKKKHFHLNDIDLCTAFNARFAGFTEILLKDGYRLYVTDYIPLEVIYKMDTKIEREVAYTWLKILRREE